MPQYKDKYGRATDAQGRIIRGAGAQGAEDESRINNAGAGGLGAIAAKNKGTTGSGVAIPAGGLTEAQKKLAEQAAAEEAEEKAHRRRAPIKPRPKASPKSDY